MGDLRDRVLRWLLLGEVGVSSETIAAVGCGIRLPRWEMDAPYDAGDFGRCYKLLRLCPELRNELPRVAVVCPAFAPLIPHWRELSSLYRKGDMDAVYQRIRELRK